ncbi:replicative DNA helicase [Candidatus Margulisiibacteriota bacterium]
MEEKIPPQAIEAERSVLAAMMMSKDAVSQVVPNLGPTYFYKEAHSQIYRAIIDLYQQNEPIDLVTISDRLKKNNALEIAGGHSYLAEILDSEPTAAHAEKYAEIIAEKAILRKLIDTGSSIVSASFKDENDADSVLELAQRNIMDLSKERVKDQFIILKDILMPVVDSIHQVYDNKDKILGVSSGYKDLDQVTSGFQKSDLIILAARPSMGKTTLALNFAMNAAILNNLSVAIFSLEMPKEHLAMKFLCSEAKIDLSRLRTANMMDHEYKSLTQALGKLSETSIFIEDSPSLTPLELRAKLRRLKAETDLKLVVIDYIQLMRSAKRRTENRFQEMSEIVREVKACARELELPIIALSQLSREVEKRPDNIPKLSDLRETGEIEQTSDLVMFIHRPDYYEHSKESTSLTKLLIEKNRNGPTGAIELVFKKDISKFYDRERTSE